jgi:hypothetical protein
MNNKIYLFHIFALCLLTFAFTSGCGKYIQQYSAPYIVASSPAIGATGVASGERLWVKFNKNMDGVAISISTLGRRIAFSPLMTATANYYPDLTPEVFWTESNTILNITHIFFISGEGGNRVYVIASREAFTDSNGLFLPENTKMWDYTLAE